MRILRHNAFSARRVGITLVELVLAGALVAVVLGAVTLLGNAANRTYRTESIASALEFQVAVAMDRVLEELTIAGADTIALGPLGGVGSSTLQYVQATDLDAGGQVVWTPLRRLQLEDEVGELPDGLDNNGNELADEGVLVLTEDVGGNERRRVLTRWVARLLEGEILNGLDDNGNGLVDERGFVVERRGETLVVRLTLQRRTSEGFFITRTAQSSTRPRNELGNGP